VQISRRRLLEGIGAAAATAAVPRRLQAQQLATLARRGPPPIRLSRNESAYGPAPAALSVIRDADRGALCLYPDVETEALRERLARLHHVSSDRIVLGAGATQVLRAAVSTFAGPARAVITAAPACEAIAQAAEAANAPLVRVPVAPDWSQDLKAMLSRCDATSGLVYLCNPHNPTGSLTRRRDIEEFFRAVPTSVLVVVDEAYSEYVATVSDYESLLDGTAEERAPIVIRSFSLAYGLAGLRVGYGVAERSVAARLEDRRAPPTITTASALAACAALDDQAHIRSVVARVASDRQEFYNQANARMLRVIDSHANFVMLNTARRAADIVEHFARNGIDLPLPFAPLDEYIRVSLGTPADMAEFWRVWDLMSLAHTR
jgi:histidinol-phosphate aminotransferase